MVIVRTRHNEGLAIRFVTLLSSSTPTINIPIHTYTKTMTNTKEGVYNAYVKNPNTVM